MNLYKDVYINEQEKKVFINDKHYGFSNIKDCNLKVEEKTNMYALNSIATAQKYCIGLYINIIIDDFKNPNVKVDFIKKKMFSMSSKKYKQIYDKAEKVLSALKLIISKNNEKYIENGTITKIENRYIDEETIEDKLDKLGKLYKDGV